MSFGTGVAAHVNIVITEVLLCETLFVVVLAGSLLLVVHFVHKLISFEHSLNLLINNLFLGFAPSWWSIGSSRLRVLGWTIIQR